MKNKIKIRYIIAGILVLVVLIAIIIFIKGIKADTKANQNSMAEIKTSYQLLEDNISTYNETRNTLATSIENYYTENLATDYSKYIAILTQEEDTIKAIKTNIDKLEKNCKDRIFSEKEVNNICSNYKEYYEKVVNIFINDKNQVNNMINIYNETANQPLEEFRPTQNQDYIDYNEDGEYLEREGQ